MRLPRDAAGHAWNYFVVALPGRRERDRFAARLADAGIATRIYYERPLHRHEALGAWRGVRALPHSEQLCDRSLALPLYPMLGDDEVDHVIRVVRHAAVEDAAAGRHGDRCDFR